MNLSLMVFIQEINLDEFKLIGIHWIGLYLNGNNITYFDSFGIKHIPKETRISSQIFIEYKHMIP